MTTPVSNDSARRFYAEQHGFFDMEEHETTKPETVTPTDLGRIGSFKMPAIEVTGVEDESSSSSRFFTDFRLVSRLMQQKP